MEIIHNVKPLVDDPGKPYVYEDADEDKLRQIFKRNGWKIPGGFFSTFLVGLKLSKLQRTCKHSKPRVELKDPDGNLHNLCPDCTHDNA